MNEPPRTSSPPKVKASLFITCILDQLFPQVGESVVRVLRHLGVEVDFPMEQTCCGQPAFNSGYNREARALAARFLHTFKDSQYVVVPSGSCTSMIRVFYPGLFQDDKALHQRAVELGQRTYEFSQFLVKVLGVTDVGAAYSGRVTYHPSCHQLRELRVVQEPRALLGAVKGLEMVPLEQAETCCGFGGTFSVKYPHISEAMLEDKVGNVLKSGAQVLVACDMSCLMHIKGALARRNSGVEVLHLAQLLDRGISHPRSR